VIDEDVDEITLSLPTDSDYSRVARAAVTNLALRTPMAAQSVEDLILAVDETLIQLLNPGLGHTATTLSFVFRISERELSLDAQLDTAPTATEFDEEARERFDFMVTGLVDDFELSAEGDHVRLSKQF
jgi:hypothetical protein